MIKLYSYPPHWGLLNASPFCMKLEVWLRLSKLPYENHYISTPRQAPKGKLPFIEDGSVAMGDSDLIIAHLTKKYGISLDENLTSIQIAQNLAFQRLVEEHLYFAIVYSRWVDNNYWAATRKEFFGCMPKVLQWVIPPLIRKAVRKGLKAQGIGRHSKDEIYQAGINDVSALATQLGDKKFFSGDSVTSIDACVYAFLSAILFSDIESPLKITAQQMPSLLNYCQNMQTKL
jgi:glutathione S-transferase